MQAVALRIERIKFKDFRSYERLELGGLGALTVFVGPNAVGKSNIVEGVQMLTAHTSFRHATIDQMIRKGAEASCLEARAGDENRSLDFKVTLSAHSKKYELNGKPKRPADLRGLVPSVTFTPDDLELVKGSMSTRRAAIDALGSQINANYHTIRRDYEKVLRHKNALLKEEASPLLIASIDEMVITCGAQLSCYRSALFARLRPCFESNYGSIAGGRETLAVHYVPSWANLDPYHPEMHEFTRDEARAAIERALEERRAEERARRRCLVGPHLDTIHFAVDGMDATHYASQGQQRSIVLSCKLAEAAVIEEVLGQKPVLLLDDVMSELDGARREALVAYVSEEVQTFVTTANLAYFDAAMLARADIVELCGETMGSPAHLLHESR